MEERRTSAEETMAVVTISTSRRVLTTLLLLLAFSGTASSQAYDASDYADGDYLSVPEYDSERELVLQIIFPFVLIYALMQFTLYNLMKFTLNSNDDMEDSEIGRYSTILAVSIPAMMLVTPTWETIVLTVESLGPALLIAFACTMIYVIYKMT